MVGVRTPRKKPVMELGHPEKCPSWRWDTQEAVMELGHPGRSHGDGTPRKKS